MRYEIPETTKQNIVETPCMASVERYPINYSISIILLLRYANIVANFLKVGNSQRFNHSTSDEHALNALHPFQHQDDPTTAHNQL